MTVIQAVEKQEKKISSLKKRSDFLRVARTQKKWITPSFIVQFSEQPADVAGSGPRIGFTASKKVGNAVQRNRAKRRLREIARRVFGQADEKEYDYVLIARQEIHEKDFNDLIRDLKWSLKRLNGNNRRNGEHEN